MAKHIHGNRCHSCGGHLSSGDKQCACGAATAQMSFKERTEWELEQWRNYRARNTGPLLAAKH